MRLSAGGHFGCGGHNAEWLCKLGLGLWGVPGHAAFAWSSVLIHPYPHNPLGSAPLHESTGQQHSWSPREVLWSLLIKPRASMLQAFPRRYVASILFPLTVFPWAGPRWILFFRKEISILINVDAWHPFSLSAESFKAFRVSYCSDQVSIYLWFFPTHQKDQGTVYQMFYLLVQQLVPFIFF